MSMALIACSAAPRASEIERAHEEAVPELFDLERILPDRECCES